MEFLSLLTFSLSRSNTSHFFAKFFMVFILGIRGSRNSRRYCLLCILSISERKFMYINDPFLNEHHRRYPTMYPSSIPMAFANF